MQGRDAVVGGLPVQLPDEEVQFLVDKRLGTLRLGPAGAHGLLVYFPQVIYRKEADAVYCSRPFLDIPGLGNVDQDKRRGWPSTGQHRAFIASFKSALWMTGCGADVHEITTSERVI